MSKKKTLVKNKQVIRNSRDTDRKKVDFMIHERVAFDFYSDDFQKYMNAWDPKVVSTQQHCFLEHGKYIKGVIHSKVKTKRVKIMQTMLFVGNIQRQESITFPTNNIVCNISSPSIILLK